MADDVDVIDAAEDKNADADMEAGFKAEAATIAAAKPADAAKPAEPAKDKEAAPTAPAKAADAKPAAAPAAPAPKYVRITEDELKSFKTAAERVTALEGALSKVAGNVGNVQQIVAKLQASTPAGESVEISEEAFAEMKKDFPEVAQLTFNAIKKGLKGLKGTSTTATIDPEIIARMVSAKVREETQSAQIEVLTDFYPNWKEIVGFAESAEKADPNNRFRKWLKTQPVAYQAQINNTNSAAIISRAIAKFQTAAKATVVPASAKPAAKPAKAVARAARIAAAVQPRGAGARPPPPKTADDEFEAGFRSG